VASVPTYDPDQQKTSRELSREEWLAKELARLPRVTTDRAREQIITEAKRRARIGFRSELSHLHDVVDEYLAGKPIAGPKGSSQSGD
jgi:hypothetical protein